MTGPISDDGDTVRTVSMPTNEEIYEYSDTTPGHPDYLTRPLSDLNAIPMRGTAAAHMLDLDATPGEWNTEDIVTDSAGDDGGAVEFFPEVDPLLVSVVSLPHESIDAYTRISRHFSATESYSEPAGQLSQRTVRMLLPKDDARTSATFRVAAAPGGGGNIQYMFAIGTDPQMNTYTTMGDTVSLSAATNFPLTVLGSNAIFGALIVANTYDSTKVNQWFLTSIAEYVRNASRKIR